MEWPTRLFRRLPEMAAGRQPEYRTPKCAVVRGDRPVNHPGRNRLRYADAGTLYLYQFNYMLVFFLARASFKIRFFAAALCSAVRGGFFGSAVRHQSYEYFAVDHAHAW